MLRGSLLGKVVSAVWSEPRLMAAKFVSPYRMAGKSGKMILLMLRLSVKLSVVRICVRTSERRKPAGHAVFTSYPAGFIEEKTATYNRLRGLISELASLLHKVQMPCATWYLNRRIFAASGSAMC